MKDIVKLGTLGDIFIGLTYRPEDVANEGTIVLRSSNIQNGKLDFADIVRVKCKVRENLIVKPNDILMCSRNGSAKLVGKCTLPKYFCSRVPMPPEIQQYWQHLSRLHQPHTKPMNIGPHQIHWICATCRQKRA